MSPEIGKGPHEQENPDDDTEGIFDRLNFPAEFTLTHLASELNPSQDPDKAIAAADLARESMLSKIAVKQIIASSKANVGESGEWVDVERLNWLLRRVRMRCEVLGLRVSDVLNRADLEVRWLLTFVDTLDEARIYLEETTQGDEM